MATVDDIKVNINVSGTASVTQAAQETEKLGNAADNATKKTKAFAGGARNVSYQIQDVAVQLSMGTSAFIVMGQQLPQLLSGFGLLGAALGALAAVGIPLVRLGMEKLGYDFRNLNDRINDLGESQKAFTDAAKASLPTSAALGSEYGKLATQAERFFDTQSELAKATVLNENISVIEELRDKYKSLNRELTFLDKLTAGALMAQGATGDVAGAIAQNNLKNLAKDMGITATEAERVGALLKQIDSNAPDKAVSTINNILDILKQTTLTGKDFVEFNKETLIPLQKIQNIYLALSKNIKAAGEAQTDLNTKLLEAQNKIFPDISAARRRYDEIGALEKEAKFKIEQFKRSAQEATAKDQVDRTKEIAAFELRTNQELADKIADFKKKQEETYLAAKRTADVKQTQLDLEANILKLGEAGKTTAINEYAYAQDLLNIQYDYEQQLQDIQLQLEKNLITQAQALKLEQEAADTRDKSLSLADTRLKSRAEAFVSAQNKIVEADKKRLELTNKNYTLSDRERKNAEAIFNIEQERSKELAGLSQIKDAATRINLEQQINKAYDERIQIAKESQTSDYSHMQNFQEGWQRAMNNYVDTSKNAFERAQDLFKRTTQGMEDLLVDFVKTGKFQWKNFVSDMLETLLRSQIQQIFAKTLSIGTAGGGSAGGSLGNIFAGFFANGGVIPSGTFGVVGERGPELVSGPAQVSPMGAGNVTYNISAVDAASFKALVARDPGFIHAVAMSGARSIPGGR